MDQVLPTALAGHGATHRAFLVPLKPDPGSERDNYYLYDVAYQGETIVSGSRIPAPIRQFQKGPIQTAVTGGPRHDQ